MLDLNVIDYPYYRHIVSAKEIREDFADLKKIKLKKLPTDNLAMFEAEYDKYFFIYKLTDYFSESCRVKCNFGNKESPYVMFNRDKEKIISKSGNLIDYYIMDNHIYDNYKLCSNFPVVIAFEVYKYFKPKHVLDFSSGWGDRLMGALAYGCAYTGTDPNKCMTPHYENMVKFFGRSNKKYKVYQIGFENFRPKECFYDLVFTSPPFFDLESYSSDKTQSIKKYNTLEKWKKNFLFHCFAKSIRALKVGCCMAIYISDYKDVKYVRDTFKFMETFKNVSYQGKISWSGKSNPKNIFVWKKLNI